ncbi:MAG: acyl carrier protein [Chloroflexota bacterium]
MSANPDDSDIAGQVRQLLATVLELDPAQAQMLADDMPLFGGGLSLDSLTGLELLAGIETVFGVDIAADDLNLDSLETIGTLIGYLKKATG